MADEWGNTAQNVADDFMMDVGGMTGKDVDQGLEFVNKEGYYHLGVESVKKELAIQKDDGSACAPHVLVDLLVLESVPGQSPAGSHLYWRIYIAPSGGGPMTDFGRESLARLGVATGILEMPDGEDGPVYLAGTKNTKFGLDEYQKAVGKQLCGHVKCEPGEPNPKKPGQRYPDKFGFPYNKGFGPVEDPRFKDVPKNREMLKLIGKEHCMPTAGSTPPVAQSKPATNGAGSAAPANKTPAANTGAKEPFDDSDL